MNANSFKSTLGEDSLIKKVLLHLTNSISLFFFMKNAPMSKSGWLHCCFRTGSTSANAKASRNLSHLTPISLNFLTGVKESAAQSMTCVIYWKAVDDE